MRPTRSGPFLVRFVPSRHSKLLFGRRVPMDGELTCDHLHGLAPTAYRCGTVWGIQIEVAGTRLYHQGSADLDDEELRDETVDVFLAGVAGRSVTPRYWERILPRLDPRLIVPTHYDDFFAPLGVEQKLLYGTKLADLPGEVASVSRDARVAALTRVDGPEISQNEPDADRGHPGDSCSLTPFRPYISHAKSPAGMNMKLA